MARSYSSGSAHRGRSASPCNWWANCRLQGLELPAGDPQSVHPSRQTGSFPIFYFMRHFLMIETNILVSYSFVLLDLLVAGLW